VGALISFELAHYIQREYQLTPSLLVASGCAAPQLPLLKLGTYDSPEPEFLANVYRLNGTPKQIYEDSELLHLMVPLLRADFQMYQTYDYRESVPLECPILALGGLQDDLINRCSLEAWRLQTRSKFAVIMFPGDHFFIQSVPELVLEAISSSLCANFRFGN